MPLYGVDVHDGYQAGLSFTTLKQQGYTFASIKLTQGTGYERDKGDDWVRAARAAGLIPGGYHWIDRSDGATQARWFYRKLRECDGPDGMVVQLDCEDDATLTDLRTWKSEWDQLSGGHPVILYTGRWWWANPARNWNGAAITPYLWDSHYLSADADSVPDDPAAFAARIPLSWWTSVYGGWNRALFIQFTSKGDAGKIANKVDLDVTMLDRAGLLALTHAGGAVPAPIGPLGEDDMTPDQAKQLAATAARVNALIDGKDSIVTDWSDLNPKGVQPVWTVRQIKDLAARLARLEAAVKTGSAPAPGTSYTVTVNPINPT